MSSNEHGLPHADTLRLELAGGVLRLTLDRPRARNAMDPAMVDELCAVFDALRERPDIRAVVLRGEGGHFCAGADLKSVMSGGLKPAAPGAPDPVAEVSRRFGTLLRKASRIPQVLVAAIEGSVLGGGFGLVCVSDIAITRSDARFGLPETTRGLPPAQIAPFVVERVGLTQARRLCLTGARFDGREALRLGLVHECVDDEAALDAAVEAALTDVLGCAPLANAMTKDIVLSVAGMDMDAVLDMAAERFAEAVRGPEAGEGITAFMQKRPPKWAPGQAGS